MLFECIYKGLSCRALFGHVCFIIEILVEFSATKCNSVSFNVLGSQREAGELWRCSRSFMATYPSSELL